MCPNKFPDCFNGALCFWDVRGESLEDVPHSVPNLQVDLHSCGFQFCFQTCRIIVKDLFRTDLDKGGWKVMQVGEEWGDIGMGQRIPVGIGFDQPDVYS